MTEQRKPGGLTSEKLASRRRRRNYGYRGYGSGFSRGAASDGGMVHWAGGFSGMGFPGYSDRLALPRVGLFAQRPSERGSYVRTLPTQGEPRKDPAR